MVAGVTAARTLVSTRTCTLQTREVAVGAHTSAYSEPRLVAQTARPVGEEIPRQTGGAKGRVAVVTNRTVCLATSSVRDTSTGRSWCSTREAFQVVGLTILTTQDGARSDHVYRRVGGIQTIAHWDVQHATQLTSVDLQVVARFAL